MHCQLYRADLLPQWRIYFMYLRIFYFIFDILWYVYACKICCRVKPGFPSGAIIRPIRMQVTIHERSGIKEAAQRRTIRKSVAVKREKREDDCGAIGAYWSNWWSAPNQEQPARERPPWECQLSNHKLIWKGKLITRSSCRALCRAEEDFPIEICKYFSACFVCANGQEIGEIVAAGRAIAGIKAGN